MSARRDNSPPEDWTEKITDKAENEASKGNGKSKEKSSYKVNDRRFSASGEDGESLAAAEEPTVKPPAYVQALEEEIRKKDETLREYISQYKAAKSQMNEAIGRIEREKAREVNFRIAELARAFLAILDDLTSAVDHAEKSDQTSQLAQGLSLITQRIKTTLENIGIQEIEAIGKTHDPNVHEAVAVEPVAEADKDGIVIEELKKGYMLGDVLVRPSSVVVGKFQ